MYGDGESIATCTKVVTSLYRQYVEQRREGIPMDVCLTDEAEQEMKLIIYECGICGQCHPWTWNGDCRDGENRFYADDYAKQIGVDEADLDIRCWGDKLTADQARLRIVATVGADNVVREHHKRDCDSLDCEGCND